jgi:hypothetical protein
MFIFILGRDGLCGVPLFSLLWDRKYQSDGTGGRPSHEKPAIEVSSGAVGAIGNGI